MNTTHGLSRLGGGILVCLFALLAFAAPELVPFSPHEWVGTPFEAPSPRHWLGTDDMGHDLWTLFLHGARHALLTALPAAAGAVLIGTLIGASAGYLGGRWDFAAMRLIDVQLALPTLPLVLVAAFYAGADRRTLIGVLAFSLWARCARELRPQVAVLRDADFIVAERAMGAAEGDILIRHVCPVMAPLLWAQFANALHHAVLLESALGFLGLEDPQWPGWGQTLYYANARAAFLGDAWLWWVLPPGLAIGLLVLSFALLGTGRPRGAGLSVAHVPGTPPPFDAPASASLLEVRQLRVAYTNGSQSRDVLHGLDLTVAPGEVLGIAGVSGGGKTSLVHTLLGLLPPEGRVDAGAAWFNGEELLRMPEKRRRRQRGDGIAWVPQAAMESLNPVRSVGSQLMEVARLSGCRSRDIHTAVIDAMAQVDLPSHLLKVHPRELSGGMRQRVVIAMALLRRPMLVLADEPTSGLDATRAQEILQLITRLCRTRQMALLLISHDLGLLSRYSDRLAIMEGGVIVETAPTPVLLSAPASSAGQSLVAAARPYRKHTSGKTRGAVAVLQLRSVDFQYASGAGLHSFSLEVHGGECVGLVGPSGAGKSTIARLALGLLRPARGTVEFLGRDWAGLRGAALRNHRRGAGFVFQDPYAALPFHRRVVDIVAEPLRLAGVARRERLTLAVAALADAGLEPAADFLDRYVDSLSGGERQRVALARALIGRPRLIVADEPTSMLDAPVKRLWLERLDALHREHALAVLLITHDLSVAFAFCDRVAVVEEGRLTGVFAPGEMTVREETASLRPGVPHQSDNPLTAQSVC